MSNPTGMHTRTARHLQQVHNQMRSHINHNNEPHLSSARGHVHQHQPTHVVASASKPFHYTYEYIELNPLADSYTYQFIKLLLHNLLYSTK
ncbi:hypothetical protein I4U23_021999 [Adineta vaga]|nr:hypothetical protein I4U23_021999 [Adineta vaga]